MGTNEVQFEDLSRNLSPVLFEAGTNKVQLEKLANALFASSSTTLYARAAP
jgi:hypothetical protein